MVERCRGQQKYIFTGSFRRVTFKTFRVLLDAFRELSGAFTFTISKKCFKTHKRGGESS